MVDGSVRRWLRLEGAAGLAAGLALFAIAGGPWLVLIPLLLLVDVSAVGYVGGPQLGAFAYNLAHTGAPGLAVLGLGVWAGSSALEVAAAVLIAHVGVDRAVGYGLKLPTSFQDTHLGRIGRAGR